MVTLTEDGLLTGLDRTHLAHLDACRAAWRDAVIAYGDPDEIGGKLTPAVLRLQSLLRLPNIRTAVASVARVHAALNEHPVPLASTKAAEDRMWELFFVLVLMVQSGQPDRFTYALQLEQFTAGADLSMDWWLDRAKAYAPLGLTIGTRV